MNELSEKDLTLYYPFKVTSADTDMEARIRLGSLVNLLIQSAISSADSLGFGFGGLRQQKLFWVLSRLTVEINQPLNWYNSGEVETWPKTVERIIYLRDFLIRNDEQQLVARATSGWLAIDLESKRPKRIDGIHGELFAQLKDKHAVEESPEKLNEITEGENFGVLTSYFDLDLNKHVTSTRYIDWMIDTLPIEFIRSNYPKKLSINYMKETMLGETIRIVRKQINEKSFQFEGTNLSNNTTAFRGKIDF